LNKLSIVPSATVTELELEILFRTYILLITCVLSCAICYM